MIFDRTQTEIAMLIFVILILSGFFYIWKKGALDWAGTEPPHRKR